MHLDRGYGHVEDQQAAANDGVKTFSIIADNRIGLPRMYIEGLKSNLKCPGACKHDDDDDACSRWDWTCLHKEDMELEMWQACY